MSQGFRWLWLGQLISNLGTQCSLYGIGLWSFQQHGQLLDFASVAFVVQLSKILVLPLLGRRLISWPPRRVMLCANGLGAISTLILAVSLLHGAVPPHPLGVLALLALAAMAEAALVLCFSSLIPVLVPDGPQRAKANGLFVSSDGLVLSLAPFAGSWLVALTGLSGVLLLDGVSFVVALLCVLAAGHPSLLGESRHRVTPLTSRAPAIWRLRVLWASPDSRPVLVIGTVMAFVYAATEILFPAWVIAGPARTRLGPALMVGALAYVLGFVVWTRWAWRRPGLVLGLGLVLQSLILMGAGLVMFEGSPPFWFGGLLVFSLVLPIVLSALQTRWQQLAPPELLPKLFAQRYRMEWLARLLAFPFTALLVDAVLSPGLRWPHWPGWLVGSLGQGPGRSMAVGLGAMGWVLVLALLSQQRRWMRA